MATPHEGIVNLKNSFDEACNFLKQVGKFETITPKGTTFFAEVGQVTKGERSGQMVIKFFQKDLEFGRSYRCCWGKYYSCNRTRIGMYCKTLDSAIGKDIPKIKHKASNYFSEQDMEDLIAADPDKYIGEKGLILKARQYSIGSYRFDLLFKDRHGSKLLVELQKGTLDRNHTYKILDYYDEYKQKKPSEFVELMVIANRIPVERRNRLYSMGISFKEIPKSFILDEIQQRLTVTEDGSFAKEENKTIKTHADLSENDNEKSDSGSLKIDESKHKLSDVLDLLSKDLISMFNSFHATMGELSNKLFLNGKTPIRVRTNIRGVTYLVSEKKAFIYADFQKKSIGLNFYTGGNQIPGLHKTMWNVGGDNKGGRFNIRTEDDIGIALGYGKQAYDIAFEES